MIWPVLFFAALAALLALWARHRRLWQNFTRLEKILHEMAEERRPASILFYDEPRFAGVTRDLEKISDRQEKLSRQIVEEGFNLRAILASMPDGVAVLDTARTIRLANDSLRKLFALETDPVGKTILVATREGAIEEIATQTLQAAQPQTRDISLARAGQTGPLHLVVSAAPIADSKGAVLVFHDISRLRQLEEIRRQFVSNVSHELRTPLSIFQGYLETLLDNPSQPPEEIADVLKVMQRHSLRLNAILEDLLTLARLESRQDKLKPAEIDLPSFIQQIVRDWALKFTQKGITVTTDMNALRLQGDASRLEQVFTNLIDNAVRYTPKEMGRIDISAKENGAFIQIRVKDNGPGIPSADLPHVFERFYRVEKARSREHGGTGLGLSIVKHIIALHGGTVRAESHFSGGATIVIDLPR